MSEAELAELFARLGARNPAQWARSQVQEGIPQLARFLFLKQAWRLVADEKDTSWIHEQAGQNMNQPGDAIAPALRRLLAQGASSGDIATVVRVMQWKLLSGLCYLLDDPGDVEDVFKDIAWQLFQVDRDGHPTAAMTGLHESVLETEPYQNLSFPD